MLIHFIAGIGVDICGSSFFDSFLQINGLIVNVKSVDR